MYIVYVEEFESEYSSVGKSGGGYFVGYKSKIEDGYSPNWFEAKKYKTLQGAINSLGLYLNEHMDTMEKFIESNSTDIKYKRDNILNNILGESNDLKSLINFQYGKIESIDSDGNIKNVIDEVISYIKNKIDKNQYRKKNLYKNIGSEKPSYIVETKEGEDFWEGY